MPLPKRQLPRKRDFCYSAREVYFLTICAKDRRNIFSTIVPTKDLKAPVVQLSVIGKIVDKHIQSIADLKGVYLEKYVVMPDHIHMLIFIDSEIDDNIHRDPTPTDIIPRIVAYLKRSTNKEVGENIFQKSYYDHIIRNQDDYNKHWDYIENNPLAWLYKHGQLL